MIKLEVSGETPQELFTILGAFAALATGQTAPAVTPAQPVEAKPKTTKKDKVVDPTGDAGQQTASASESQATTTASAASGPVTRDSVSAKCMAYGAPSKGGPGALKELFTKHGSPQGNFSGVPEENLGALSAELDSLLG